jgi:magnesium-transporting ATPase (P-type)
VILVAVVFGLSLPLTPVQILWINLVTAITLSLSLAYEPAEPDLMQRPPRDPRGSILPRKYLGRIGYVSAVIAAATMFVYFYTQNSWGWSNEESRTTAVTMLAVGQAAYLFSARSLRKSSIRRGIATENPVVWLCIGALLVLQLFFVYVPFMNNWFESAPLPLAAWLLTIGLSIVIFLLVELGKVLFRNTES